MSRAFVKEPDGDQVVDDTPDLPISPHPNYVTPSGLEMLEEEAARLQEERGRLKGMDDAVAAKLSLFQVERRLRYVRARIESAILHSPGHADMQEVTFGATVDVVDEDDREYRFQVVGEDEADIAAGKISYMSPLAKALLGAEVGDSVTWRRPKGDIELEILAIAPL